MEFSAGLPEEYCHKYDFIRCTKHNQIENLTINPYKIRRKSSCTAKSCCFE